MMKCETLTVPEAGEMLGISRTTAYTVAKETGELAGVKVLQVGHQLRVPKRLFLAALGIEVSDVDA